tara:strand:- start:53 stop:514 length:462 start_codon:yes stop_codon:yes gene_type:complete
MTFVKSKIQSKPRDKQVDLLDYFHPKVSSFYDQVDDANRVETINLIYVIQMSLLNKLISVTYLAPAPAAPTTPRPAPAPTAAPATLTKRKSLKVEKNEDDYEYSQGGKKPRQRGGKKYTLKSNKSKKRTRKNRKRKPNLRTTKLTKVRYRLIR